MKKNLFFISLFFIVILGGCNGCSGGKNSPLTPPSLATITISPHLAEIVSGTVLPFQVIGYDQYGAEISFTPVFTITPSELGTITLQEQNGIFTAIKKGSGTIKVTGGNNITAIISITVITGPLNSLILSPAEVVLYKEETLQFSVWGIDAEGNAKLKKFIDVSPKWLVTAGDIGEIDNYGLFKATRQGRGQISAEIEEDNKIILAIANIEVKNRPPVIISGPTANPESILINGTCNISVSVKDDDNDVLMYNWSAEKGTISGSGNSVSYVASSIIGRWKILVLITDGFGGRAEGTTYITTSPTSEQIWERTYGGEKNDYASSIVQTQDGGYIVVGGTNSQGAGGYDVYVVKLTSSGILEWEKVFGGANDDYASSIIPTQGGGYIVVGGTNFIYGNDTKGDVYILKLNSQGEKIWERTYGGASSDYASSIVQTPDGGYIVAGWTTSSDIQGYLSGYDVYVLKLDVNGDKLGEKAFGDVNDDYASSIAQTQDGGYMVAGGTNSFGAGVYDVYIVKLNSQGEKIWERTYGGASDDYASSIVPTPDGGYIVAGGTKSFVAVGYDVYILKLNSQGEKIWERTYGGASSDYASSIVQTPDGGYILTGGTNSSGAGGDDVYVVRLTSLGEKEKETTFGDIAADKGASIQQTQDGRYIIAGETFNYGTGEYDMYVIKTDIQLNKGRKFVTKAKAKIYRSFSSPLPYQKFTPPFNFK